MAKVRGGSLYAESADKMYESGQQHPAAQEVSKFCKEVLDKNFENWVVIGRDQDPTKFKEVEGGNLMSGMIAMNLQTKNRKQQLPSSHCVKDIDAKSNLAMMILDLIEAVCDSENEAEEFAKALATTIKRGHEYDHEQKGESKKYVSMDNNGKPIIAEYDTKEEMKIDILKNLLLNGVDIFNTYKGQEKFLRSCLSSLVVARILDTDDEELKNRLRASMKASIAGDKKGGAMATSSIDGIDNWITTLLDAIDAGKTPEEIQSILKTFNNNL